MNEKSAVTGNDEDKHNRKALMATSVNAISCNTNNDVNGAQSILEALVIRHPLNPEYGAGANRRERLNQFVKIQSTMINASIADARAIPTTLLVFHIAQVRRQRIASAKIVLNAAVQVNTDQTMLHVM